MDTPPKPFPLPFSFPGDPNPTLTAVVDVLSSTVESYRAAFEACAEVNSLCIRAEGREDPHPGIAKFQRMFFAMPPEPHETRINASLFILKSLHDDDEYGIC